MLVLSVLFWSTHILAISQTSDEYLRIADSIGLMHTDTRTVLTTLDSIGNIEKNQDARFEANYRLGKYYLLRMDSETSRKHFHIAATIAHQMQDAEREGFALDRIGISHVRDDQLDSALICFQNSLDLYINNGFEHRTWNPLQGISRIYQQKNDYTRAKEFGERAWNSLEGLDEPIAKTIVLNHLMSMAGSFEAFEDYSKYLDQYLQTLDPKDLGYDNHHIGAYFPLASATPEAKRERLLRAIKELSSTTLSLSLMSAYFELGKSYFKEGAYQRAIESWTDGRKIDRTIPGIGYELSYTREIARAYEAMGNYQKALYFQSRYFTMSDSIANLKSAQAIEELQMQYETAEKEETIAVQALELAQKKREQGLLVFGIVFPCGAWYWHLLYAQEQTSNPGNACTPG